MKLDDLLIDDHVCVDRTVRDAVALPEIVVNMESAHAHFALFCIVMESICQRKCIEGKLSWIKN